jgi:regulator of nucleoside diphosphate kinase
MSERALSAKRGFAMLQHSPMSSLPHIIVSGTEELRLSALANAADLVGNAKSAAKALLAEMSRAHVVADSEVPRNVVRMNSFVEFEIDGRDQRPVRLVFPAEADINRSKISVLTPIGAALIGLMPGQVMLVEAPDGKMHQVRVLSVAQLVNNHSPERNATPHATEAAAADTEHLGLPDHGG